ncbi:sigma-70 family RNA polymerase sigma factor (plasmid) [Rossellomorea sp. AcN35-11]|nr:sigma-70 family RNA polymerase sigma factor [Rossellomorea aquimaris]WJV32239.1 sigma-70 family RNA polymerase sigma factor [Rossellomorea sp. AcN35-11]
MIKVEEHSGLIQNVINRTFGGYAEAEKIAKNRGMDIEDLFQIGYLAMLVAAKKFNPEKGKWSTIAYHYIRGYIMDEINNSFPLKMPTKMDVEEKKEKSKVRSLHKECNDGEGLFLLDIIPCRKEPFINEVILKRDLEVAADKVLTTSEKVVVFKHVYDDAPQNVIAIELGQTRQNVCHLLKKAKSKLAKEVS